MKSDRKFKIECEPENALTFFQWIATRGGIAKWNSVNLSNPGASWSTPATIRKGDIQMLEGDEIVPYPKPSWQCGNDPEVITNPDDVGVYESELFKAFNVALRRGDGFSFVLTDGSQRKLEKALEQCAEKHGDSFYRRGVLDTDRPSMGIYFTKSIVSLSEWIEKQGAQEPQEAHAASS